MSKQTITSTNARIDALEAKMDTGFAGIMAAISALQPANVVEAPVVVGEVVAVKVDGRNHEARQHNYEARIARRQDPTRKGGAGMTKTERRELAAALRAEGKDPSNARVWNAACKKARGI